MSEGHAVSVDDQRKLDGRAVKRAFNDYTRAYLKWHNMDYEYRTKYKGAEEVEETGSKAKKTVASPAAKPKKSKKREAPPTEQPAGEEAKEQKRPKEKKEKKPKEKTADWSCKGNVIAGEPCPIPAAEQTPSSDTKHNGAQYNTCVVCKKAVQKAKRAEKKASGSAEGDAE